MPTTVSIPARFQKLLDRLARKYPKVIDVVAALIETLKSDQRPGDKIPHVKYDVYKVRLRNPSAGRGKSGGFRVIYYAQLVERVVLLAIYSKTEQTDISPEDIRHILQEILPLDAGEDNAE
jgi:mRNA-degrading endonuclease RelE of RelBE toxin-antitoxin system